MKNILKRIFSKKQKNNFREQRNYSNSVASSKEESIDLICFFREELADIEGRMLGDILKYTPEQIESKHDFIQWIFPTIEKSRFNRNAPVINGEFKREFKKDELAKQNFCKSCQLYLNYIGFHCIDREIQINSSGNKFYELPFHNQLRITRVLNSLTQIGNTQCSANLYNALLKEVKLYPNKINDNTLQYWKLTQGENMDCSNVLIGAIAGDIIGSKYEANNIKSLQFPLFGTYSRFTDDTVMTVAVADWLLTGDSLLGILQDYGNKYPYAGYGGAFKAWLKAENPEPYKSWGNGSAMRVSFVGWMFETLDETLQKAKESAEITHNHPEGIKGAQATAACVYLARTGKTKQEIKEYVETTFGYNLNRTCDEIRPTYQFDVSCQGSVPEAIIAFLESTDFEHAIRLAISLGGDSDTIAAITGGIAEAYYKEIPEYIKQEVLKRLPDEFVHVIRQFYMKFLLR